MALRKLPELSQAYYMYRRGEANAKDVLATDLGQWPPRDLDIVHEPDFMVRFRSSCEHFTVIKTHAEPYKYRLIFIFDEKNITYGAMFFLLTAGARALKVVS